MNDLKFAFRQLRKSPGFTFVVAITLALGIGANAAIFTIVDTVVFRPLPYRDPARIVKIWDKTSSQPIDNVSWPDFVDVRTQTDLFEQIAADDGTTFEVMLADGSHRSIDGAMVTIDWLPTLGVQPILGRGFLPGEDEPGRDRVVILSYAFWQRQFGADPHIVGTMIGNGEVTCTVIGVLPPNVLRYGAELLRPLVPASYPRERSHHDLDVFARLKPGVTLAQAQAALDVIGARLARDYPESNLGRGFRVAPLGKYYASIGPHTEQGLLLMLGAVALVLLVACANVTNLLLARVMTRARECVLRTALGASRARLLRQMLVESVLLFLIGGTLGLLVARWSMHVLLALSVASGYVPSRMAVIVDGRVLAFSLVLSLIAGVISGIAPALQASRVDLSSTLKTSNPHGAGGLRRTRAKRLLIVAEIAMSFVLLVGSGLMIRSFLRLEATPSGVDAKNLLVTESDGGREFAPAVTFWRAALERARQFPGVEAAALTSRPPIHGLSRHLFRIDTTGADAQAGSILISPDYFRTMGIRLLKGRVFTDQDAGTAPPVVIVSESIARRFVGDGDPLGRRVMMQDRDPMTCCSSAAPVANVWREIVGVVSDVRQVNLDEPPAMTIYQPFTQIVEHDMFLMLRMASPADASRGVAQLRPHLLAVDAAKQWSDVRPMQDAIDGSESIRVRRFVLTLLASFAGLALLLAAVGTYGVMAYAVTERTHEIGIRIALGATQPAVLRDVLGESLRVTALGLIAGAGIALFSTRYLSSLLFAISAADAVTYATAALLLVTVAAIATYMPARRAVRIDPLIALRNE
jgi:putative ABC transport system permease protein